VAAQRVGPSGSILATDVAAPGLEMAAEDARQAGLTNVETRVMDAQQLDLESGSFDAVIARLSLQFVPDTQRALAEIRRVLKPGGRFAALVWGLTERNPYRAVPQSIASRLAGRPFPEAGPGQWALRDQGALEAAFREAGFQDVEVRAVPVVWRFDTLAEALTNLAEAQPQFKRLMGELSDADRATAWTEVEQALQPSVGPDGFASPGEALIAVGTA
jgi:ubiquinone/menaquinone biosynthesis C-methylase UbiE